MQRLRSRRAHPLAFAGGQNRDLQRHFHDIRIIAPFARAPIWLAPGFGHWPQVKAAFRSIALFRWDINVRESALLGLVGAGGVGMILDSALDLFQWTRVATILLAIVVVVMLAEIAVTFVRGRIL
jgi:hypothetical protein